MKFIITLILGFAFGCLLIATQAFSWFRIQQMFHFESFHMYGVLFTAIGTAALSLIIIKKFKLKSIHGNPIEVQPKKLNWKGNIIGGLLFGIGWGLTGACSAPLYILMGMHVKIGIALFLGSIIGAYLFGIFDKRTIK
ncbi:MAG: YeeE/YedE family protein [Flavobacteriia bacterium]|nr:YeeE/YedE family protein [Flavobacteriia bacterium]